MMVPPHCIDMYQPAAARSESRSPNYPSLTGSFVLATLGVGLVVVASVVTMAPAVVGAFTAGFVTAVVVTGIRTGSKARPTRRPGSDDRPAATTAGGRRATSRRPS
jgi:hypothetical protein